MLEFKRDTSSTTGSRPEESKLSLLAGINLYHLPQGPTTRGTRMTKTAGVLLLIFLAAGVAGAAYALATTSIVNFGASDNPSLHSSGSFLHQGLFGKATIGNISPVCTIGQDIPSTGPSLIIASADGRIVIVPLNWSIVNGCSLVAQYHVTLQPGTYSVTLSPCPYMGCQSLPATVVVLPGIFSQVDLNIVTGIV